MEFFNKWDDFIGETVEKSQMWECEVIGKSIKDRSHLTQKTVTDKNGHQRKVWVKVSETAAAPKNNVQEAADRREMLSEIKEFKRDIKGENTVDDLSKQVKFSDKQNKAITDLIKNGDYKKGDGIKLLNDLYSSDRDMYSELTHMNNTIWNRSGKKQSTYSPADLIANKVNELIENTPKENSGNKNSYADLSDKEFIEKYKSEIPSSGRAGTKENFMNNLKHELSFQEELKKKGSSVYSKTKHELLQEIEKRADKISEIYNLK